MDPKKHLPSESWELFDADALFPPPRLHANKVTKVDKKEGMKKVAPPEGGFGDPADPSNPEELGDTYCDASADQKGHVDDLMEMEGLEGGTPDNRDVQADKTEDKRTQKDSSEEESAEKEASGQEPAEAKGEKAQPPKDGKEAPKQKEGAEKPIQKESEGVKEVAEATSKTSEDVHGGDEATKDIEDSPNAADDGKNPDNHGAEKGKGGEDGEGEEGADGAGNPGDGTGDGQGDCSGDPETGSKDQGKDPMAKEDWEAKADQTASSANLLDMLDELEAKSRDEKGHRTGLPNYNFNRESSPVELEIAFRKASELLRKFANEEDLTKRSDGNARWDARVLVRNVVAYRHPRIPSSKYERPKNADICILLDISGSCAQQAEMFMAIAAGSIGCGVRVFVGYNGSCRACEMQSPERRILHYDQAKPWVQAEVQRVAGWQNARGIGEWSFEQFLEEIEPKTVIIFGDWDGIDQYTGAVQKPRFKKIRFFWFANEDFGRRRRGNSECEDRIPKGFTKKNYVPGVFTPRDFASALKRLK